MYETVAVLGIWDHDAEAGASINLLMISCRASGFWAQTQEMSYYRHDIHGQLITGINCLGRVLEFGVFQSFHAIFVREPL